MGKVSKIKSSKNAEVMEQSCEKQFNDTQSTATSKSNNESFLESKIHIHSTNSFKKKDIVSIINNEHLFISSIFEILDLAKLNQGRRSESDEDDDSDGMQLADIPEEKVFKKQTQKKGSSQVNLKNKSFPQTVEGLQKELAELKGTPMTYQKTLRKKGLQSRLIKKKRREKLKLTKAALKLAKKQSSPVNGLSKNKPILNSDGNVVSNKFDFADTDIKKESKKKGVVNNEIFTASQVVNRSNGHINKTENNNFKNTQIKKESNNLEGKKVESNKDSKTDKPVFNKDNKMVFSKVYIPQSHNKLTKRDTKNNNPKKILEKLKEENKKMSELEKEDKEKAVSLKEKQKWAAALKRAGGEKVRDDPELLRKSIAREKNKKVRSQKKWKARIDHVEKEKEEKQKKRKENIQARKTEKKKKKMKKAIKRGSYVPL